MRKNIVIAIISIIAVVIVVNLIRTPLPPIDIWVDNRISASFEASTINETVGEMPVTAELHIDASGSMKPYFRAEGAGMINTLDPEVISLGGGVSRAKDIILDGLEDMIRNYVAYKNEEITKVVIATLGADAGIVGAAFLS